MREYGIRFSQGLRKGLRQFPTSSPTEEMLIECFNLQPGENGLLPHDELFGIGIDRLAFTFFCVLSEIDERWCIFIDTAGQINTNFGSPETINGFEPVAITPDPIPYWLEFTALNDPDLTLYVYPDITGSLTVDFTAPDRLPGFNAGEVLLFAAPNGYRYELFTLNTLETSARALE
jgi:hypothetical protein